MREMVMRHHIVTNLDHHYKLSAKWEEPYKIV